MLASIRAVPNAASRAASLLRTVQFTHPPTCPCHSNPSHHRRDRPGPSLVVPRTGSPGSRRRFAAPGGPDELPDYAFEMAASSVRFGPGVTRELDAMRQVREGLTSQGISFDVYANVRVEPKDSSIKDAIDWVRPRAPDAFLAIGGGSVIDTAKLMNLYLAYPEADFLDFVNAPLGKGRPVDKPLKPLIAVPTTAGIGSETTGTAIFDLVAKRAKTGISHRNLKPTLGICDPVNTKTMPAAVKASSSLDVLCHALESWTAIPYYQRTPRPLNPIARPTYQGANPISDIFSLQALRSTVKYLPHSLRDPDGMDAQTEMLLASTLAGVGFGNAGAHLCYGMSYPISSQNPGYKHAGYDVQSTIIPHGVSVAVSAPAVFKFMAASNPERHLQAAQVFGIDVSNVKKESAGEVLAEALTIFLAGLGDQPRGLKELGFGAEHIDALVEGTIPQARVLNLAPGLSDELEAEREQLRRLFEDAMSH